MKKIILLGIISCLILLLGNGCGLCLYEDWKNSTNQAIVGGGAVAGKDYINGLLPSEESRKYFAKLSTNDQPVETVSRTDDKESSNGVRYVKNGGILIPPGTTISYTNKGYCMDPNLPAPKSGEEFQLVPTAQLIPEELQGTYKKLLEKASTGDTVVQFNMQHLVWALRTVGTDAAYANNLTTQQKRILGHCSDYQGQFEDFHATAKSNSKMMKELLNLADSYLNVKIGRVSYKASDLLDPDVGSKKINEHLNQLIDMSKYLPVEKTGFNYGELQPGIYTDVKGSGSLQFTARIANSTNQPFIYYPQDYVGQVGSGVKSQRLAFFATANSGMRQRTTQGVPKEVVAHSGPVLTFNRTKEFRNLTDYEAITIIKYAKLAHVSYEDGNEYLVENIVQLERLDLESGFFANVYKDKNGGVIISFRGTELKSGGDLWTDFNLIFGNSSKQRKLARDLIKKYIEQYPGQVILTGHSLGGYLAISAALGHADKLKAIYAYNAPGIDVGVSKHFNEAEIKSLVDKTTQIYHKNDTVLGHTNNNDPEDVRFQNRVKVTGYYGFFGDKIVPWNNYHGIVKLIKRMEAEYAGTAYY